MKLVPLGDRVVLKQLEAEETTKSVSFCLVRHRKNHSSRGDRCRSGRGC